MNNLNKNATFLQDLTTWYKWSESCPFNMNIEYSLAREVCAMTDVTIHDQIQAPIREYLQ